ncbi:hypothetical protein HPB52_016589 [Rhipicephalus sanguineus]|uniref:Uncharacterized protein n=1 Tax=Rhipicephalus sanguineus TaxID=34632 RepID=A0A9D4T2R2_RHISA|nr:hypothetical protein HPB52_016589 [Rhipicephalus sanguineus]
MYAMEVGYTMKDIRYRWSDGDTSVRIAKEVELPQFKVLGHVQKAKEVALTTGKSQSQAGSYAAHSPKYPPFPFPQARKGVGIGGWLHPLGISSAHRASASFRSLAPARARARSATSEGPPLAQYGVRSRRVVVRSGVETSNANQCMPAGSATVPDQFFSQSIDRRYGPNLAERDLSSLFRGRMGSRELFRSEVIGV